MNHPHLPHKLRIGILVTETTSPSLAQQHGDMFSMFQQVFHQTSAIGEGQLILDLVRFNVLDDPPQYPSTHDLDSGHYDGLVITGSTKNAHDDDPWIHTLMSFIQQLQQHPLDRKVPLVGICFGHQIIARALGGVCERNPHGWEFGPTLVRLTDQGRSYFGSKHTMCLNQIHQDHVPFLPPGFIRLATTEPHTSIQAMVSADGRCLSIQGHPEISCAATTTFLDILAPQIPDAVVQDARDRLQQHAGSMDDLWLAEKILLFFCRHLHTRTTLCISPSL
ncbi:hypothetical protein [Absidia glauca]|uniref:Glutamine amidotransferase domain-containing protein n=1 Tax=Absidia glauca TaxID=4829 RepID=A0A163K2C3_ABSGL|nr:hypothetical protein [Absidia glauca]